MTRAQKDRELSEKLGRKLDQPTQQILMRCACIMLVSILMHDGDHIRQAINWGYTIPASLWVLNLTVYILPVLSIFLIRMERAAASIVCGIAGFFTSAAFLILHLCGSASGLWGVWNYSYFALMKGVTYEGVYYQGVDWISWVFLFEVPALCIPSAIAAFRTYGKRS